MGKKITVFIISGIFLAGIAFSQSLHTGTIQGVVKTPEGVSVPGVIVLLKSPQMVLPEFEDVTNAAGMYKFHNLSPGVYEMTFILAGFQKIVKKDITIAAGTTVSLDIDHKLRATSETVVVEGKEPRKELPINL
jgi:hypothetical protein